MKFQDIKKEIYLLKEEMNKNQVDFKVVAQKIAEFKKRVEKIDPLMLAYACELYQVQENLGKDFSNFLSFAEESRKDPEVFKFLKTIESMDAGNEVQVKQAVKKYQEADPFLGTPIEYMMEIEVLRQSLKFEFTAEELYQIYENHLGRVFYGYFTFESEEILKRQVIKVGELYESKDLKIFVHAPYDVLGRSYCLNKKLQKQLRKNKVEDAMDAEEAMELR